MEKLQEIINVVEKLARAPCVIPVKRYFFAIERWGRTEEGEALGYVLKCQSTSDVNVFDIPGLWQVHEVYEVEDCQNVRSLIPKFRLFRFLTTCYDRHLPAER